MPPCVAATIAAPGDRRSLSSAPGANRAGAQGRHRGRYFQHVD